jgi:hypothetical protein
MKRTGAFVEAHPCSGATYSQCDTQLLLPPLTQIGCPALQKEG